jgi:hypothetical protein
VHRPTLRGGAPVVHAGRASSTCGGSAFTADGTRSSLPTSMAGGPSAVHFTQVFGSGAERAATAC